MTIKRYISTKDNTIVNAFRSNLSARGEDANLGGSDILECYSIFGQASSSSLEQARIIMDFPVDKIENDRVSNIIPQSGSVEFVLKLSNTPHGQSTPEDFVMCIHPIVKNWQEGGGIDMESFLDLEASNWKEATAVDSWNNPGGDFVSSSYVSIERDIPLKYQQSLLSGVEDIEINLTSWVEEWLAAENSKVKSTATVSFATAPAVDSKLIIYSHEGQKVTFTFIATETTRVGNNISLQIAKDESDAYLPATMADNFIEQLQAITSNKITGVKGETNIVTLTQSVKGFHGNTQIGVSAGAPTASPRFTGGVGLPRYGLVLKMDNNYENGSKNRSYYTKKFYSRTSHEFFLKPQLEARFDRAVADDRSNVIKSSSLSPSAENLNSIYVYNKQRGSLVDIPHTGTNLVVQFYEAISPSADPVVVGSPSDLETTFITASKVQTGVYKATFAYSGSASSLRDVWKKHDLAAGPPVTNTYTSLITGSGFDISSQDTSYSYEAPKYAISLLNLKDTYSREEKATFRVYTRDKNWKPNVYTIAKDSAPVTNIKNMYYKIAKVSDKYEVIGYSTGSGVQYSRLSYDSKGSYFDFDMKLLEPNNAYEISFLFKDGEEFLEQQEKFRFRVEI